MSAGNDIDVYSDRMTCPIVAKVINDKAEEDKEQELSFVEPAEYFNEEMRKKLDGDEEHGDNDN